MIIGTRGLVWHILSMEWSTDFVSSSEVGSLSHLYLFVYLFYNVGGFNRAVLLVRLGAVHLQRHINYQSY